MFVRAWEIETHDSVVRLGGGFGREAAVFSPQIYFVFFGQILYVFKHFGEHFETF